MALTYRYNADALAQAQGKYNPQKKNMAMLELHVDGLVPGAQEILMLSLQSVTIPGYSVARGEIQFLNGTVFYPSRPEPLPEMTVTFREYHDVGNREILEKLFYKVYDPRTGAMGIPANVKSQATLVLLREDDSGGRPYLLDGVWPMNAPGIEHDMGDGEQMIHEIRFSVDFITGRDL
jgi:hypothetical protein